MRCAGPISSTSTFTQTPRVGLRTYAQTMRVGLSTYAETMRVSLSTHKKDSEDKIKY